MNRNGVRCVWHLLQFRITFCSICKSTQAIFMPYDCSHHVRHDQKMSMWTESVCETYGILFRPHDWQSQQDWYSTGNHSSKSLTSRSSIITRNSFLTCSRKSKRCQTALERTPFAAGVLSFGWSKVGHSRNCATGVTGHMTRVVQFSDTLLEWMIMMHSLEKRILSPTVAEMMDLFSALDAKINLASA